MAELFRAELGRLRTLVAIYGAAHLALLVVLGQPVDLLQQPLFVYQLFAGVHVLAALAFGAWQLRAHRRPAAWLFLLHRPLPPARIGLAVLGAGSLGAAIAVAAPIGLGVAAQALLTVRVVDTRHVGLVVAAALLAALGQLAGALLILAPRRHAFAALAFLVWPVFAGATGPWFLVVLILATGWLGGLALHAFRPDPLAARVTPALVLPVAMGVAFVIAEVGALAFQLGWIACGTHPLNSRPPAGGYVEAVRAAPAAGSVTLARELERWPHRHELTNLAPMELDDGGTRWVFSHDRGRFVGMDLARTERRGELAVDFAGPPLPLDGVWLLDAHGAARLQGGAVERILSLPAGETLAARPERLGDTWIALSDRALHLGSTALPLPVPIGALGRVDVAVDGAGWRVAVLAGRGSLDGGPRGQRWRYHVDGGTITLVDTVELAADFPAALRHADFLTSPGLLWLRTRMLELFAEPAPLLAAPPRALERSILALTIVLSLAAAGFTARRAGVLGLPGTTVVAWTLAALALGWPLALAFCLTVRART